MDSALALATPPDQLALQVGTPPAAAKPCTRLLGLLLVLHHNRCSNRNHNNSHNHGHNDNDDDDGDDNENNNDNDIRAFQLIVFARYLLVLPKP